MNWKNLKLKFKFTFAFGAIISLLVVVALWAIFGINGIVDNAEEVIEGNKLRTELEHKYVQHLQWASSVTDFISNSEVTALNVQLDYHKCDFGVWYYGEGRENAEELAPELSSLFQEMEEPHKHLHESATKIKDVHRNADYQLSIDLANRMSEHLQWAGNLKDDLLSREKQISVETNHKQCKFGKWFYSNEVQQVMKSNPEFGRHLSVIEKPHKICINLQFRLIIT